MEDGSGQHHCELEQLDGHANGTNREIREINEFGEKREYAHRFLLLGTATNTIRYKAVIMSDANSA